jgi:hypothetical protein
MTRTRQNESAELMEIVTLGSSLYDDHFVARFSEFGRDHYPRRAASDDAHIGAKPLSVERCAFE